MAADAVSAAAREGTAATSDGGGMSLQQVAAAVPADSMPGPAQIARSVVSQALAGVVASFPKREVDTAREGVAATSDGGGMSLQQVAAAVPADSMPGPAQIARSVVSQALAVVVASFPKREVDTASATAAAAVADGDRIRASCSGSADGSISATACGHTPDERAATCAAEVVSSAILRAIGSVASSSAAGDGAVGRAYAVPSATADSDDAAASGAGASTVAGLELDTVVVRSRISASVATRGRAVAQNGAAEASGAEAGTPAPARTDECSRPPAPEALAEPEPVTTSLGHAHATGRDPKAPPPQLAVAGPTTLSAEGTHTLQPPVGLARPVTLRGGSLGDGAEAPAASAAAVDAEDPTGTRRVQPEGTPGHCSTPPSTAAALGQPAAAELPAVERDLAAADTLRPSIAHHAQAGDVSQSSAPPAAEATLAAQLASAAGRPHTRMQVRLTPPAGAAGAARANCGDGAHGGCTGAVSCAMAAPMLPSYTGIDAPADVAIRSLRPTPPPPTPPSPACSTPTYPPLTPTRPACPMGLHAGPTDAPTTHRHGRCMSLADAPASGRAVRLGSRVEVESAPGATPRAAGSRHASSAGLGTRGGDSPTRAVSPAAPPPPPPPDSPPAPRPTGGGRRELPAWVSDTATAGTFLRRIGFGEYAGAAAEHRCGLLSLSLMSVADLQLWLGVSPPKEAVTLHQECAKLRILFARRASEREIEIATRAAGGQSHRTPSASGSMCQPAERSLRPVTAPLGPRTISVGLTGPSGWMVPVRSVQPQWCGEGGRPVRPWTPTRSAAVEGGPAAFLQGEKRRRLSLGTLPEAFFSSPKPHPPQTDRPAMRPWRPAGSPRPTPSDETANGAGLPADWPAPPPTAAGTPRADASHGARQARARPLPPRTAAVSDSMRAACSGWSAEGAGGCAAGAAETPERGASARALRSTRALPVPLRRCDCRPASVTSSRPAGPARHRAPPRVPDTAAEAEAAAAKAEVEAAVEQWERHVAALRALVPCPASAAAVQAADALVAEPGWVERVRAEAALLLRGVRACAVALLGAIDVWKRTLRQRFSYFASVPHEQLAYFRHGEHVLLGLSRSLAFLPAPSAIDPLLLRWFGEQLPWICRCRPALRGTAAAAAAEVCRGMHPPMAAPPPTLVRRRSSEAAIPLPLTAEAEAANAVAKMLLLAQAALLSEARLRGASVDPDRLIGWGVGADNAAAEAAAEAAAATRGPGGRMPRDTWWWSWRTWQLVLYGSPCYSALLCELPHWLSSEQHGRAARAIQNIFLIRRARMLLHCVRVEEEARAAAERERRARLLELASSKLNAIVRGKLVRMAGESIGERLSRGLSVPAILKRRRAAETTAKTKRAVAVVHRAVLMLLARREMVRMSTFKRLMRARVAEYLATAPEMASAVESAILRATHSSAVQWSAYQAVVAAYEVPGAPADAWRDAALDDRLREQIAALETAKLRLDEAAAGVASRAREQEMAARAREAAAGLRAAAAAASAGGGATAHPGAGALQQHDGRQRLPAEEDREVGGESEGDAPPQAESVHATQCSVVQRHAAARSAAFAAQQRALAAEAAAAMWAEAVTMLPGAESLAEGCEAMGGGGGGSRHAMASSNGDGKGGGCDGGHERGEGCAEGGSTVGAAARELQCHAAAAAAAAARRVAAERAAEHAASVARLRAWVSRMLGQGGDAATVGGVVQPPTSATGAGDGLPTAAGARRQAKRPPSRYSGLGGRRKLRSERGANEYLGSLGSAPRSTLLHRRAAGLVPLPPGGDASSELGDTQAKAQQEPATGGVASTAGAGAVSPAEAEPEAARMLTSGDADADAAEMLGGAIQMANAVGGWPELLAPLGIQPPGRPALWVTLYGGIDEAAAEAAASRARLEEALVAATRADASAVAIAELLAVEAGAEAAAPHRAAAAAAGAMAAAVAAEVSRAAAGRSRGGGGDASASARAAAVATAARASADAKAAVAAELSPLRASWLQAVGSLRLCSYVRWRQMEADRLRLSVERTAALREMLVLRSAGCIDPRREGRAQVLALAFINAALALARKLEATPVQEELYTSGTLTLRLIEPPPDAEHSRKGAPKPKSAPSLRSVDTAPADAGGTGANQPAAPGVALERAAVSRAAELAASLNRFELAGREDRLRVRSAAWTSERVTYLSGSRVLPMFEVVLEAQREVEDEATSEELLRELQDAAGTGYLSTLLGVTSSALARVSTAMPKLSRRDAPSLVERRQDAERQLALARTTLQAESVNKEEHKATVRQWELTAGAIRQLRQLSTQTQAADALLASHHRVSSTMTLLPASKRGSLATRRRSSAHRLSMVVNPGSDDEQEGTGGRQMRGLALTRKGSLPLKHASEEVASEAACRPAAAADNGGDGVEPAAGAASSDDEGPISAAEDDDADAGSDGAAADDGRSLSLADILSAKSPEEAMPLELRRDYAEALRAKAARREQRAAIAAAEGELWLIDQLQRSAWRAWAPLTIHARAGLQVVDRKWNVGLTDEPLRQPPWGAEKPSDEARAQAQEAREEAESEGDDSANDESPRPRRTGLSQLCYYCASLPQPIRMLHPFYDCPKRRKARVPEFSADVLHRACARLEERREVSVRVLATSDEFAEHWQAVRSRLLRVAGAIRVASATPNALHTPPAPPPPPPRSERAVAAALAARRRSHTARHILKLVARSSRHAPNAWAEVKAVALMAPLPRLLPPPPPRPALNLDQRVSEAADSDLFLSSPHATGAEEGETQGRGGGVARRPISPEDVQELAVDCGADLETPESGDHHLIPLLLALARMPLPNPWVEITQPREEVVASAAAARLARAAPRFVNPQTGETSAVHPAAAAVLPLVLGTRKRTKNASSRPIHQWVQFATGDGPHGGIFFYGFGRGGGDSACTPDFPDLGLAPSPLPPRKLETSASALADAAAAGWPGLEGDELVEQVRRDLWEPVAAARAAALRHSPCPVDELVAAALLLGIDTTADRRLTWLLDFALAPMLPLGWCVEAPAIGEAALPYYWNALSGAAQWEHPNISIATGVLSRLRAGIAAARAREAEDEARRYRAALTFSVRERALERSLSTAIRREPTHTKLLGMEQEPAGEPGGEEAPTEIAIAEATGGEAERRSTEETGDVAPGLARSLDAEPSGAS